MFDPVARSLYKEPAVFGSPVPTLQSWNDQQLLAIDSLFIPENNSDFPGVRDWSYEETQRQIDQIRAPAVISHVSAARVLGLPLPYKIAADP